MDLKLTERRLQQCRDEIERHERRAYPGGFPGIPPIPTSRYVSQEFFALENQHFWPKSWLYAGFANELPEIGSYKLWEHSGKSIVLVRGNDGEIRAFYNTCRHRGGALVKDAGGQCRVLICKFHGWTYDLQGQLKGVPLKHDFADQTLLENGLLSLRCEMWGNMIFVNRDAEAPPLLESLGPLVKDFEDAGLDRRVVYKTLSQTVRCNWKIILDAFAEGYHLPVTHPKTVHAFSDHRSTFIQLYRNGHSAMYILTKPNDVADSLDNPSQLDSNRGSPAHRITRESILSYTIFPNIIVTQSEFQYAYVVFWPSGLDTTIVETVFTAPPGYDDPDSEINRLSVDVYKVILGEDIDNLEWLQKSIESGANQAMPISYSERRVYQIAEEIDRRIGVEKIPEHMRVAPTLESFYEDPYAGDGV